MSNIFAIEFYESTGTSIRWRSISTKGVQEKQWTESSIETFQECKNYESYGAITVYGVSAEKLSNWNFRGLCFAAVERLLKMNENITELNKLGNKE